jgi:hypothetical protein
MQDMLQFTANSIATPRVPRSISIGGKLILVPLLLLTLASLAMEAGAWRKYITIAGPFAAETSPPRHSLILAVPNEGPVPWWQQPLNNDSLEKPNESRLYLSIDGHEMWPAHSKFEQIRKGETEGFSHWESGVIFSLPPGLSNSSETVATLSYNIKPRPWVTLALLGATLALAWLSFHGRLKRFARRNWDPAAPVRQSVEWLATVLLPVPYLMLVVLCCLGVAGFIVFLGASLYALANGWALPTTAPIRWFPIAEWAARSELYFGQLLFILATFGAFTNWLAFVVGKGMRSIGYELKLRYVLRWCGLPIVVLALVICLSAMWNGIPRPGDLHGVNIGGLVPFSDAQDHLDAAYAEAKTGFWSSFAARRPLAAAFRSTLLFASDYSFAVMLILQCCLLAIAMCLASYAIMIWRGIWAAVAFLGLAYIYARAFVPTALTESLGLFWSLLSVPFFVDAFRSSSMKPAIIGFAMTAAALMTRMGSMFTVPALLLWLIWQFGQDTAAKIRVGLLAVAVLVCVFGMNALLQNAYGTAAGGTGSNFSYVICGLSIGTAWDGCPRKLAEQGEPLVGDEVAVANKLYAFAWMNFQSNPLVILNRLKESAASFKNQFPQVMWRGYGLGIVEPPWLIRKAIAAIALVGLIFVALRRARMLEITFWGLLWTSIIASAAVIFFDDGARVLAASQPLIALFFAIGLINPALAARETEANMVLLRSGVLGLIAAAVLFVSVPWVAFHLGHYSSFALAETKRVAPLAQNEARVAGGRRIMGFLVVSNEEKLRPDVPSLHFSDFEAIVALSGVEDYQPLLHPVAPAVPFGFVYALGAGLLIVPPEVLERPDVPVWRFELETWRRNSETKGNYWTYVTRAEPWRN